MGCPVRHYPLKATYRVTRGRCCITLPVAVYARTFSPAEITSSKISVDPRWTTRKLRLSGSETAHTITYDRTGERELRFLITKFDHREAGLSFGTVLPFLLWAHHDARPYLSEWPR